MESRKILLYFSRKYDGDWESIYNALKSHEEFEEADAEKASINLGSKYITVLDDEYPEFLKSIYRPPFVLYYHGDISLLNNKLTSVAVVGSRLCTEYGIACTQKLVSGLPKEIVVVSGMAQGIDSVAHVAAIRHGAKTIAVLGSGINRVYPTDNVELYERIKRDHLVISEYPDKTAPTIRSFPIRNRIVAGLTNVCLVTEGALKSGSSITATMVLNSGGSVCCVPYPFGTESLCNHLIHYGACLVENSNDILEEMNYSPHKPVF